MKNATLDPLARNKPTALNAIPVLQRYITNVVTPSFMPEFTDNLWTTIKF